MFIFLSVAEEKKVAGKIKNLFWVYSIPRRITPKTKLDNKQRYFSIFIKKHRLVKAKSLQRLKAPIEQVGTLQTDIPG